ncbi:hypothetical protein [Sphingobium sp. MI1205]|uniref:hypothetical protein n=1 Tax=Sphingobium sp. MI1205 TaxID=407020 RepID=UPI0007704064|nr:hypothetical protein [Sphingobium sp. MI1205]AMK18723.1 hypothetical protein K663_11720 [Sphingobium sp. MI1205]
MITIIHGPTRTGKTLHRQAFARHYGCSHIVDNWNPSEHELPAESGRLVLTDAAADAVLQQMTLFGDPIVAFRMIDIVTARLAIGVGACAPEPEVVERLAQ